VPVDVGIEDEDDDDDDDEDEDDKESVRRVPANRGHARQVQRASSTRGPNLAA